MFSIVICEQRKIKSSMKALASFRAVRNWVKESLGHYHCVSSFFPFLVSLSLTHQRVNILSVGVIVATEVKWTRSVWNAKSSKRVFRVSCVNCNCKFFIIEFSNVSPSRTASQQCNVNLFSSRRLHSIDQSEQHFTIYAAISKTNSLISS